MSNGKDRVEIMNHQERLAMFQRLETGAVTDAMVQLGVGSWMEGVYPTSPKMKVFGRAVTAQFSIVVPSQEPIDQFQLVSMCRPGDVLVWNVPHRGNICGENIMHFLGNRQVNGLIIDGYTRDKATIEEMGIPQFTKGISIAPVPRNCRATAKDVNVPVSCGGAVVNPGDYLFGDIDGVMVIPEASVDDVLLQAELNMEYEQRMEQALNQNADYEGLQKVFATKVLLKR